MIQNNQNKLPPCNEKYEVAYLGSLIMSAIESKQQALDTVELVNVGVFAFPKHQEIYNVIAFLISQNGQIDITALTQEAISRGMNANALIDIIENQMTVSLHADFYADKLIDLKLRRDVLVRANATIERVYDLSVDASEHLETAATSLHGLVVDQGAGLEQVGDIAVRYLTEDVFPRENHGLSGVPTGSNQIDYLTDGFMDGDMTILAARPGVGKTALAMYMAMTAAEYNRRVCFFSAEMSGRQLVNRILSSHIMGVDGRKIRRNDLLPEERNQLADRANELKGIPMFIDDKSNVPIHQLRSTLRRAIDSDGIDIAFIDYLQLLSLKGFKSLYEKTTELSHIIKDMASEFQIPVVALAQLKRLPEGKDRPPTMSDLRDSGAIEQDAAIIILLNRDKVGATPVSGEMDVLTARIAKNRHGICGAADLTFNGKTMRFEDYDGR